MTALTMSSTLGDLLKYELNGNCSRETVTLKSGTNYALGPVLGKITGSGKYRLSPAAQVVGDEGAETAIGVLIESVDATAPDKTGLVVARGPAIVSKTALVFDASVDQAAEKSAKHAQLAAAGTVPATLPDPTPRLTANRASTNPRRGPNHFEETRSPR